MKPTIFFRSFFNRRSSFFIFAFAAIGLASFGATFEKSSAQTPVKSVLEKVSVKLSENGRALMPIVISAQAGEREKAAAQNLAAYLKRITGGEFKIEISATPLTPSTPGIVLGTAARFAAGAPSLKTGDPTTTEDYLLRSHASGVLLIGASELALDHAVWDLLYRIGYRQFFPGETWEVVPSEKNLSVAVNVFEHPDYYARRIWFGYGALPENQKSYEDWNARNRMAAGINLKTGHAYQNIIARNKAEFEKHPEYLTRPGGNKFCVSNAGLRALVIKDSLAQFAANPQLQSISLDPSDGGGWESDSCPDDKEFKSVTDRAITLANAVAQAVTQKYPDKYIGLYAYNEHSPPPTIQAHPRVVVSIATGFIRGGYSIDQLLAGWNAKTTQLGIREYYSVNPWDRDLPGRARGSNTEYLRRTLTSFNAKKAHFLTAESSDNWGSNGLGYYLASRMMWDVDNANRIEALREDFLTKAFGAAREPMAEFYRLIDGANQPLLSSDLIGRLYRQLDGAMKSTPDAAVQKRLNDLALYVRYVELFNAYSQATGAARQTAFEDVMRFAWRIRRTHMIHTLGLWRDLPKRDEQVKVPAGADYNIGEPANPWKNSEPFTREQIVKFVSDGVANNEIVNFKTVEWSHDLVPAKPLNLTSDKPGQYSMVRGKQDFYTWVEKAPATIVLKVQAGLVYNTRGAAKFSLYPAAEPEGASVSDQTALPDKAEHELRLETTFPGLHRISVSDGGAGTHLEWAPGTMMTVESSVATPANFTSGRWSMYFYVPKGTKVVGGYRKGQGQIVDGTGKVVLKLAAEGNPGFWSTPVAPGQDGKIWMLQNISGQVMLMTTPPQLAQSAQELLLPKEVVAADAAR